MPDTSPLPIPHQPLIEPCPHCEDGLFWDSHHGGNDPDTWPSPCFYCDGAGERTLECDYPTGFPCSIPATEILHHAHYCPEHAARVRAED